MTDFLQFINDNLQIIYILILSIFVGIEVITRWDTLKVATKEYVPKYIRKTIVNVDTFQAPIDTMSILRDYYAKYFYTDTIKVDSL